MGSPTSLIKKRPLFSMIALFNISGSEGIMEWETLSTIRVKQADVLKLLLNLHVGKATGSDGIPALFLKYACRSSGHLQSL